MLINIWEEKIIYEWEDKKGYEKTEARNSMMVGNCSQNIMVNIGSCRILPHFFCIQMLG